MGLTRAEQETVIRWDEDEQEVRVWSASPRTWRRMVRLGVAVHRETTAGGKPSGRFYRMPAELFRWGTKRKAVPGAGAHLPRRQPVAALEGSPREELTR